MNRSLDYAVAALGMTVAGGPLALGMTVAGRSLALGMTAAGGPLALAVTGGKPGTDGHLDWSRKAEWRDLFRTARAAGPSVMPSIVEASVRGLNHAVDPLGKKEGGSFE